MKYNKSGDNQNITIRFPVPLLAHIRILAMRQSLEGGRVVTYGELIRTAVAEKYKVDGAKGE